MADKDEPQEKLMPLAGMRIMAKHAKDGPMPCAFGLTKEKAPLLLIEKLMKPKKVRDTLKRDAVDAVVPGSIRFGTVVVKEEDPTTLNFTVNKPEVGGTIAALVKLARKISFAAVVINVDESLENEEEHQEQTVAPAAPPPPAPPPPPPDDSALTARLRALVQQAAKVIAADPARHDALMALAQQVRAALGGHDLPGATAHADALEAALQAARAASQAQPAAAEHSGPVALAKSRLAWLAVRRKLESDLEALAEKIIEYDGGDEPRFADLDVHVTTRIASVLAGLDESLADALDHAYNAADPEQQMASVAKAQHIIQSYEGFIAKDKLLGALDTNPFLPLATMKAVTATLTTLAKALH